MLDNSKPFYMHRNYGREILTDFEISFVPVWRRELVVIEYGLEGASAASAIDEGLSVARPTIRIRHTTNLKNCHTKAVSGACCYWGLWARLGASHV